ncbi:MAG: hypothetical protein ACUVXG_05930 [Anaerolineae bacterium]
MTKVLVAVGIVVLVALAAVGGYLLGRSGGAVLAGIPVLGDLMASQPASGQFLRGQFDPTQMTEAQRQQFRQFRGGGQGGSPAGTGGAMAGGAFGTIEAIEDEVLVIRNADGSTTKVKATDTTLIQKLMDVELSDLEVGEAVTVSGSPGDDGIITARSIRVMTPGGR